MTVKFEESGQFEERDKHSKDGSDKANIVPFLGANVLGSLYSLTPDRFQDLKQREIGYKDVVCKVITDDGRTMKARVFEANNRCNKNCSVREAYKKLLLLGAEELGLPQQYIQFISQKAHRLNYEP